MPDIWLCAAGTDGLRPASPRMLTCLAALDDAEFRDFRAVASATGIAPRDVVRALHGLYLRGLAFWRYEALHSSYRRATAADRAAAREGTGLLLLGGAS